MKLKYILGICLFDLAVHNFEAIGFSIMPIIAYVVWKIAGGDKRVQM